MYAILSSQSPGLYLSMFVLKTVETVSCFEAMGVGHTVDATSSCETSLVGPKQR